MLTFGSLFSGIGGIDLGLERAGMTCRWQVEINDYCSKVLEKHWPNVRRYRDIKLIREGDLEPVDLIAGGPPCQPVSVAGKRKGQADSRWLWPEFFRIVCLLRPRFVFIENVPGLLRLGGADVLRDLASIWYDAEWESLPASAFGAPHRRDRVWIVAYDAKHVNRINKPRAGQGQIQQSRICFIQGDVAESNSQGQPDLQRRDAISECAGNGAIGRSSWWDIEPDVRGMVDGLSEKLDGGKIDASQGVGSEENKRSLSEERMRILWFNASAWLTPQGQESDEQFTRELANALSELPHDIALGKREATVEAIRQVSCLRKTSEATGLLRNSQQPISTAWESLSGEEKEWVIMATFNGQWINEWPGVPRVSTGTKSRVNRLKALGNAVVPQVVEWIGRRIIEVIKENSTR